MRFFLPAIRIMDILKYRSKFTLVMLLMLIPMLVLSYLVLAEFNKQNTHLVKERHGLQYISKLRLLIEHLPEHRALADALLTGNQELSGRLTIQGTKVDEAFAALRAIDARLGGELSTGQGLQQLQQDWNRLKAQSPSLSSEQSFQRHTQLIADGFALIHLVADHSELTLDDHIDSHYLVDLLTYRLPSVIDTMSQARELAITIAAAGHFTPQSWSELTLRVDRFLNAKRMAEHSIAAVFKANMNIDDNLSKMKTMATDNVSEFARMLQKDMLEPDSIQVNATQVSTTGGQAIGSVLGFYDDIVPSLNRLIDERINVNTRKEQLAVLILVAVLALVIYLFSGFFLSVRRSIQQLSDATLQLAQGDLTARVQLSTRDELNEIAHGINHMAMDVGELVGRVTASINQMATAAEELSVVTTQTQEGVSRQQQEIAMVASSINEMGSTVEEVARSAGRAAEAANEANTEAQTGQAVVNQSRQAIGRLATDIQQSAMSIKQLEEDSRNIGSVLDVIKEIAEQTNLLALNAAIEAARAGESGRGFAVVADEVRTLASRTQDSTSEIEQMISHLQSSANAAVSTMESSRNSTDESVNTASDTEASLNSIARAISEINDMNAQIASASEQQTAVAEEINISISNINSVSEQAASGALQTKSSSEELAKLAGELQQQVQQFKL